MTTILNWPTVTLDGISMQYRVRGGPYPLDDDGVEWQATRIEGWFGSPAPTVNQAARLAGHGSYRSPHRRAGRNIALEFVATAPNGQAMRPLERRIAALCSDPDTLYTLTVTEDPVGAFTAEVELSDELIITPRTDYSVTCSAQFRAPDPRLYGPWGTAGAFLFTGGTGGMDMSGAGADMSSPGANMGDPGDQGTLTLISGGTAPTGVVMQITGPVTEPSVYVSELATRVSYAGELLTGQTLWINTGDRAATPPNGPTVPARSTLLDDAAMDHLLVLDGGWPELSSGVSNWSFTAGSYDPNSLLLVHARTGWW